MPPKISEDIKTKFHTFNDKYDKTTKMIEQIREPNFDKIKFTKLASVLINMYKIFNKKIGNDNSANLTSIDLILDNYDYNNFIRSIQDTCKTNNNDCENAFALQNISEVLKNNFTPNKQMIVKIQLATLFLLDVVNMWLKIIYFIETNPDKNVLYPGYETKFSKLFKSIISDNTIFEYVKGENLNSKEIKKKYLKEMFLDYLLKGMEITNKCTNNLADMFDTNFKSEINDLIINSKINDLIINSKIRTDIGEDIFCMKNYVIYFFIKKELEGSITQILKNIDNNNEKTIDELLKTSFDKKYGNYELQKTLNNIKSNSFNEKNLSQFCDKVRLIIKDPIIKKIIIAANKKMFIKKICDTTFQEQIKMFICGNVADVSDIYKILGIANFEGKQNLINNKGWIIDDKNDEKNFKIMGIENDLIDKISGGSPKEIAERKRLEAEAERKRLKAEAERKRLKAEAERKRLEAEAERKRLEEAERKRLEEEAAKKTLEEENKRLEEEAERKRLEEEAAKKRRLEAEEAAKKRLEEEDERKRLNESLSSNLNNAFKEEPQVIDDSLKESLAISLNGSLKDSVAPVEDVDNQLQKSLLSSLNVAFKKESSEEKIINNSTIIEEKKEENIQYTDEDFIKLIIKNPPKNEDAETIIKIIQKINSQEPQEIDKIGNTHFHYIAGSFYEQKQKHNMFNDFDAKIRIKCFNYQNAEGTTPLMILLSKCEKIDQAEYVNIAEDIEQEDIYGNSIFSILTKKMVEFSRKEEIQNQNPSSDFIKKIIQHNKFTIEDMPETNDPIDPLENTVLHYVAGSFLSMTEKMRIMNDEKFKDQLNYQNAEGATPLMILTKHMTKTDLTDDVKQFIAENIGDLEQEDIYGNSVFSILTKKMVEFSGEEKVEFQ
jgi:hypothetical protein